jgi:hypothetical protein
MKRFIFNALTGLSLLMCVASAVLWVRSFWVSEGWPWTRGDSTLIVGTMRGTLSLEWMHTVTTGWHAHYAAYGPVDAKWMVNHSPSHWHGFAFGRIAYGPVLGNLVYFLIPCSALVGLTALLPLARVYAHYFRRKKVPGLCASCGYDLRATPDQCPECGTVPAKQEG